MGKIQIVLVLNPEGAVLVRVLEKRFSRIALGSALECAATIDDLMACEAIDAKTGNDGKRLLFKIERVTFFKPPEWPVVD